MKKWKQVATAMLPRLAWWLPLLIEKMQKASNNDPNTQYWIVFPMEAQAVEVFFERRENALPEE
jgi:hypothetical protein